MCFSAILGAGSALVGAAGSRKAAKAQENAANRQMDIERQMYEETTDRFQPFYDSGLDFQNALRFELLGGPRPTFGGDPQNVVEFTETVPGRGGTASWGRQSPNDIRDPNNPEMWIAPGARDTTRTRYRVGEQVFDDRAAADAYAADNPAGGTAYRGFEATPYQNYLLETSRGAIDNSAASRGNLFSGATIKAQQERGNALAGGFYSDYLNRLTGQASQGQAAAGNMANAGANFASGTSNALSNIGNAQAAGAIGTSNAILGGANNAIGLWNYQNQTSGGSANALSAPWASGGFWG